MPRVQHLKLESKFSVLDYDDDYDATGDDDDDDGGDAVDGDGGDGGGDDGDV